MNYKSPKPPDCPMCRVPEKYLFGYQQFRYYRCPRCTLVSTWPLPTPSQIIKHYRHKLKHGNYQLLSSHIKQYRKVYEDLANRLETYAKNRGQKVSGSKLLDIGCFTGEFIEVVSSRGADAYGVELQKEAVKIANQKFPGKVFQADLNNRDFPKKKFDLITMLGLIEHVPNPDVLLNNVHGLLKSGGIVMIQTPDSHSFFARILQKYWPPFQPIEHIHLFNRRSLNRYFSQKGYHHLHSFNHLKPLTIAYVFNNFANFGPEFYRLFKPLAPVLNRLTFPLPFYGGEMVYLAQKQDTNPRIYSEKR